MSIRHFLISTDELPKKRVFYYKDIIADIESDDMLYGGKISFEENLSDCEKEAIGGLFQQMRVYALHSDFGLNYRVSHRQTISQRFAVNSYRELAWLKAFISSLLDGSNIIMIVALWVGSENNLSKIKTRYIEIDDLVLSEECDFEFKYGVVYQFVNNKGCLRSSIKPR